MHEGVAGILTGYLRWMATRPAALGGPHHFRNVADVGSYDVNGTAGWVLQRENFIPESYTGFDCQEGPNVDVVVKNGVIPQALQHRYDLVICMGVLPFSPNIGDLKRELDDLASLQESARIFVTTCATSCQTTHTCPNMPDTRRMDMRGVEQWLAPEWVPEFRGYRTTDNHTDLYMVLRRATQ